MADGRSKETGIEFIFMQTTKLLGAGEVVEGELDVGKLLLEAAEDGSEPGICGGGDDSESKGADEAGLGLTGALPGIESTGEDAAGFDEEYAA